MEQARAATPAAYSAALVCGYYALPLFMAGVSIRHTDLTSSSAIPLYFASGTLVGRQAFDQPCDL